MRKIFLLLFTFASVKCYSQQNTATTDVGVVINGVRWATRNVDAPGTFAATPESLGMHFQWNRRQGWSATGEVTGWDSSIPTGTTWARANDPCPPGWRVPTSGELRRLRDAGSVRETRDGVNGHLFGTAPNLLFLPLAGNRSMNGTLFHVGSVGFYWSSAPSTSAASTTINAMYLFLREGNNSERAAHRAVGFSVRCVAE